MTGRRLMFVLATMGVALMVLERLTAQGVEIKNPITAEGGEIDWPSKANSGEGPPGSPGPGCFITFRRGKGLTGPPCAFSCKGPAGDLVQSYQAVCSGLPEGRVALVDGISRELTLEEPFDPNNGCTVIKGDAGDRVGKLFLPKGHPRCFGVTGEPHLHTYDGARFDLQAAGEFVFTRSLDDSLEVQARLEARGTGAVSVATAVAARIGAHRVTVMAGELRPMRIDGESIDLPVERPIDLPDAAGGFVVRTGHTYSVVWPDGTNVHVSVYPRMVDFWVLAAEPRDGRLVGVGGNADGDDGQNDFRTRDGRALASPPDFDTLYGVFAESWRVAPGESLFDYGPGESTATFTDRSIPTRRVTLADLGADERAVAEDRCRAAGVFDPVALEHCTFDLAMTGDDTYIQSALSTQAPAEFFDSEAPPIVSASSTVESGGTLTATWRGPAGARDYISVALRDQTGNQYSSYRYVEDGSPLELTAPDRPGTYELRYVDGQTRQVLATRAVAVNAVAAAVVAAAEVGSGAPFAVEWTGPANSRDYVSIAEPGVSGNRYENYQYIDQGSPLELTAPDEPGTYEVRYVQQQSRTVLVSRSITVLPASATVQGPRQVAAGARFAVEWTGPANARDFVSIAEPAMPGNRYVSYRYTRDGARLELTAPTAPGEYEVRYVQGQSRTILARWVVTVRE